MLHAIIDHAELELCVPRAGNDIPGIGDRAASELLLSSSWDRHTVLWCLDKGLRELALCVFHLESVSAKLQVVYSYRYLSNV